MVKLPGKKKRFCEAYIRLNNATKAAAEAGYSAKSARTTGYRLLKEEAVAEYIRARLREIEDEEIAKTDEVLRFLTSVMRGEVADQFGLDAQLADRIKAGTELLRRYAAAQAGSAGKNEIEYAPGMWEDAE